LFPDYTGIRPKINSPTEEQADFVIQTSEQHKIKGLVNLFGIESPGLTSALSLAKKVANLLF
jgi:L-2-hydroxyglutarate oxidase LhgO